MCGRAYSTFTDEELKIRYLNRKPVKIPGFDPNYNLAPTQHCLVLHAGEGKGELAFDLFRWGLVPFWAKEEKIGYKMINARAETIAEKPAYRQAFQKRRCIIPLSGFIEWKAEGEGKRPFRISLKDEPIMSVAGIWETWESAEGKKLRTFSIVTTEANSFMSKIHDRMPVILKQESEEAWLDPKVQEPGKLEKLLKPCPASWLQASPISTRINNPRNNSPDVLHSEGEKG